jgi:Flp pilus assembly protein TadG
MITAIPASKILRSTSGQSLVELTLIVPFMLLLVLESLRWALSSVRT